MGSMGDFGSFTTPLSLPVRKMRTGMRTERARPTWGNVNANGKCERLIVAVTCSNPATCALCALVRVFPEPLYT